MDRIPLLIIGGGIGGLATALAAAKAGHSVHVLEKSAEFAEFGAGLQLAPNATRVLDNLGVFDQVKPCATFPSRLVMMDAVSGKEISALDLGPKFLKHFGYPYIVMHRGDLLKAELDACRSHKNISLEANKEVVSIDDLTDGARVTCADGSIYECRALVAADGLWSKTRKLIVDDGNPVCSQFVAYRGTIPIAEAPLDSEFDAMVIWVGPDLHFVQYVVHHGTLFNQVAVFRSYRYNAESDDWGNVEELDEHYGKMCPRVRTAVAKIKRDRRWPMLDRLPIPNWTRNRITLLGDAAHPMLQYIAQGACQALEDAACLGQSLRLHPDDAAKAFAAYQQQRIPRTAKVQQAARFFGDLKHIHGVGIALRNALLAKRAPDDFEYFDWLYAYKGC